MSRAFPVDLPESEYYQMWIVEFESGLALTLLNEKPLFTFTTGMGTRCLIRSVSQVYTTEIGRTQKLKLIIADLQNTAKLSGKDYVEVLQEMMVQISGSIADLPAKVEPAGSFNR